MRRADLGQFARGGDRVHCGGDLTQSERGRWQLCFNRPRTRGMWMNSQGEGIGPTGTSIRVGSRRGKGAPQRRAQFRRVARALGRRRRSFRRI